MLFQRMQRAGNQSLFIQDRELRLEISQHSPQAAIRTLGAGSLDQFPELPIHLESRNQPLTRAGQSLPDGRDRIKLMVRQWKHLVAGSTVILLGWNTTCFPSYFAQSLSKIRPSLSNRSNSCCAGKRRQHVEGRPIPPGSSSKSRPLVQTRSHRHCRIRTRFLDSP